MNTLKALFITACIVLVVLSIVISGYIIYLLTIGISVVILFLILRKIVRWQNGL